MKKHIPNLLTLCNLILGWVSVYFAFSLNVKMAIYSIILASIFDFLDGFSARILNITSNLGAQLDSLADFITFGIAPALIVYNLIISQPSFLLLNSNILLFLCIGFVPVFAAIRLARFNSNYEKTSYFIGLPSPGFALLTISLIIIFLEFQIESIKKLFPFIVVAVSSLMVLKIKFIAFKFKEFRFRDNKLIFSFLFISIISILLLIIFGYAVLILPIVLLLYLIFSIIFNFI